MTKGESVDRDDYTSDGSTLRLDRSVSAHRVRPASFDLRSASFGGRTGNFVTPVKNQNPFGTCWSFGAIAAAETSYLTEMGTPVSNPAKALDLSDAAAPYLEDESGDAYAAFYVWDSYPINLTTEAYDPENPPAEVGPVETFRLFNPWTNEHLFTQSAKERDALISQGWRSEGISWYAQAS